MAKRAVFTEAQNAALRDALVALSFPSQAAAAEALGIEQQSAGRLTGGHGGFSYASATKVAQLSGYSGVDAFFAEKGIAAAPASATDLSDDVSHPRAS